MCRDSPKGMVVNPSYALSLLCCHWILPLSWLGWGGELWHFFFCYTGLAFEHKRSVRWMTEWMKRTVTFLAVCIHDILSISPSSWVPLTFLLPQFPPLREHKPPRSDIGGGQSMETLQLAFVRMGGEYGGWWWTCTRRRWKCRVVRTSWSRFDSSKHVEILEMSFLIYIN